MLSQKGACNVKFIYDRLLVVKITTLSTENF